MKKFVPFAFAAFSVLMALFADLELMPLGHRYAPFIFAVLVTAFLTGLWPSLLATVLAVVAANYFDYFIDGQIRIDADDLVQLAIFLSISISISFLTTRRRRAERNLAEANAELRALDRAKDQFIAMLSHELRAPMAVILGWAGVLRGEHDPELTATAATAIETSARAQARLVDDLLDMSRLTLGKMHLEVAPVDVSDIAAHAIETIQAQADDKKIDLQLAVPAEPCTVFGDPLRLNQICWNLLANAVKFTPEHGHVALSVGRSNGHVRVVVTDDGDGITKELQPHIFEPLRQARSAEKGGLGLGLAIVKQLVEMHRGSVSVQSDGTGKGAQFTVDLPVAS
ncbi:MAG TPA: HAMP domain-containing sensor histidine kinase [Thermoanaerobaculia bacterium]